MGQTLFNIAILGDFNGEYMTLDAVAPTYLIE